VKRFLSFLITLSLIPALSCTRAPKSLVLLHSNDTHGVYRPYAIKTKEGERIIGGMETVGHYVKAMKAETDNIILIDGGDLLTGTPGAEIKYRGVIGGAMIEFLNRLGFDVWCLGNHDFDKGQENALGLARLARFPTIMANITYKEDGKHFPVASYHILEKNGLKVGITAVMEEDFLQEVQADRIEGLDVLPMVPTLASIIPDLEKITDLVVVIVHGRFHEGVKVAENVPGIDVILVASEDGKFEVINGVLIQSSFGHQRTLGYLKVDVKKDKIVNYEQKQVWLWADVPLEPSPGISELMEEVEIAIGKEYAEVVGYAVTDHTREGCPVESLLGSWITDAMRWKTGAQVAFYNSQGIRADIPAGPVIKAAVFSVMPFYDTLKMFNLSGNQVKDLLEHDVERGWDRLQASGLKYRYFAKGQKAYGKRVDFVEIENKTLVKHGQVLWPEKVFTVVCNGYLAGQAKKKYFGFEVEGTEVIGLSLYQILIEWMMEHKTLDYHCQRRIIKIVE